MASATSPTPLFGRAYELLVETNDGSVITLSSDSFEPEALRITFDIELNGYQAMYEGFICVYNLNSATLQTVINQGKTVTLNAGYQVGSNYGTIFNGKILRCMFEKENVTDYKLTMQCVTGMQETVTALLNFATGPFQTQAQLIAQMANPPVKPGQPVPPTINVNIAGPVKTGVLPCPVIFFGSPKHYIEQIARDNNLTWTLGATDNTLHIGSVETGSTTPDLIYSSPIPFGSPTIPQPDISYSIVGTPQQVNDGVMLRVLLDSRPIIKFPCMNIMIDATVIRQIPVVVGQYPPVLSQDGSYALMGVRHIGDSRGNEWHTEMHLCLTAGQKATMLGDGSTNKDIRQANIGPNTTTTS